MIAINKRVFINLTLLMAVVSFVSCVKKDDSEARAKMAYIAETTEIAQIVDNLYVGSAGDIEALARILGCTPSSIRRLEKGQSVPTVQFEERIREVYKYYALNNSSFTRLRYVLDPKWHWYDTVRSVVEIYPMALLYINVLIMLLVLIGHLISCEFDFVYAFCSVLDFIIALVKVIAIEVAFFLIIALTAHLTPSPMQDNYTDNINPAIEKLA